MAKQLDEFPADDQASETKRRYPWDQWTNAGAWEIRKDEDYDVPTENMRVNLHMKGKSLGRKVRTRKISGDHGEGLVFQFLKSEEEELVRMSSEKDKDQTEVAQAVLYEDAVEIYDRAREEVTIPRKDGTRQKYAANRFKQQIDKGNDDGMIVPTIARIVRRPTLGFGHLENAERPDLMVENLVIDREKPYHHLFSPKTVDVAQARMDDYRRRKG